MIDGPPPLRERLADHRRRLETLADRASERQLEQLLHELDAAIERWDHGEYGVCEACHEKIGVERLRDEPIARFCLECLSDEQSRALEHDLSRAASAQRALLPSPSARLDGWAMRYVYRPLGAVSGDHLDLIRGDGAAGRSLVVFGDVSGKGVAASLLMSQLWAVFRSLPADGLPLPELLSQVNRLVCLGTQSHRFATLVVVAFDGEGGVELVNAGHPAPLVVGRNGAEPVPGAGVPLGLFPDAAYESWHAALEPGEALVLFTDGLTEAERPHEEQYGEERLRRALATRGGGSAADLLEACLADHERFRQGAALSDDLSLMVLARTHRMR